MNKSAWSQALRISATLLANLAIFGTANALQITSLSPQGEVTRIRQLVARFDEPAVNFGNAQAAAPLTLSCSDAKASAGSGRWVNEKEWAYDFSDDLPPGISCNVLLARDFKSPKNAPITGPASYRFTTGGPFVQFLIPSIHARIDENQYFLMQLNGEATRISLQANVWCAADGVGEKIPLKMIEGAERTAFLKSMGRENLSAKDQARTVTFACNRTLTPSSKVQIVFGKGVTTPSGISSTIERRFAYQVREPFAASFTCERENAQSACMPIRPMTLSFNAPITRKDAEQIKVVSDKETYKPTFDTPADDAANIDSVTFAGPFPESTPMTLQIPSNLKDASSRELRNASMFPLKVSTGAMPPIAKFAASPFGIVERFAEPDGVAVLPVTIRNVSGEANPAQNATVSTLNLKSDKDIISWFRKVQRYDSYIVDRKTAARDVKLPLPKVIDPLDKEAVQTRMLSLLGGQGNVKTLAMPKPQSGDPRAFEVVGIPLPAGFHVLEIASQKLGTGLLDQRYGDPRTMYVRTTALVTNLAVHFKLGRENSLAWVTSLDKGLPVANAVVKVSTCNGEEVATGTTDAQGVVKLSGVSPEAPNCTRASVRSNRSNNDDDSDEDEYRRAYFVSARDAKSDDLAFTWSDWTRGIESWRFNVPVSNGAEPDTRAHTVFDRTLLRVGETISMKHFMRIETSNGFAVPRDLPDTLVITHQGTGTEFTQPMVWRKTATGGQSAENTWQVPPASKLGEYSVSFRGDNNTLSSGSFRVEEFRLPVFQGSVKPSDAKTPLIAPAAVPTDVQVGYVSGGPAINLPVRVSALMRNRGVSFADHDGFSFSPPRRDADGNDVDTSSDSSIVVADKLPVTLDRNGVGKVELKDLPASAAPRELLLEATYADPNGEVQTIRSTQNVWPAGVLAGIKTEGWVSANRKMRFQALALDLTGKPRADVPLKVTAVARITTTSRKRMVGGFYAYDNKTETKDLGSVCSGKSDSRGLLLCETSIAEAGEVEFIVSADDGNNRSYRSASSVWVTRQGEMWFGGENHDRMDVLPEKKSYEPGETARFQVRMPFRFATALVSVEREGIIQTEIVKLSGDDPTVSVKIKPEWGPNVYVSVMALRGRLREVPWYSFFTWGFKQPREWWNAFWYEGREYVAPTAMVDLSKPAYRIGLAEIRVGTKAHQIAVSVSADKPAYPIRSTSRVTIKATLPDGKPAANAEVAVAAVDEALLELMPNSSWNLLDAMLQRRSWGVETSTAQMEIIGRRHYGRKAIPAGGGGGHSSARELLDTLLLWNPKVVLDAKGEAVVNVPLNDALTTFRIVAVADSGEGMFGTGQTSIRATQDLQIISGLPPLIREGDQFKAQITLRNTTTKPMKAEVTARATLLDLAKQNVDIPAGEAREVSWNVTAPSPLGNTRAQAILWEIEAKDSTGGAKDALKASQRIVPAVPVTVRQATLVQLESPYTLDVAQPPDAIAGRGGIQISLQPKLSDGMPGVSKWFADYPFICLEQKTSKSIGMRDLKTWQSTVAQMPAYLDSDGLANYFPPRDGEANGGSDILTAYILSVSNEASMIDPAYAIPDAVRVEMERGLVAFVEGKIKRTYWSPRADLDIRKLAALEALSRFGSAQARMIQSITIAPNQWPTDAVIDWLNILRRVKDIPQRDQKLAEATQILRARISYQGTRMLFSTERDDYWWWLMRNGDVSAARLLATVIDDPEWKSDLPRLATGLLARQQRGAWATTTANLWGSLAIEKFSTKLESTPVAGSTKAALGTAQGSVEWAAKNAKTMFLAWPENRAPSTLNVTQQGSGKPWMTIQSLAAVPLLAPANAGYQLKKTITPVEQASSGKYSRGDVVRVKLEINASTDMTWVVMSDPIPGGATILGTGLGRDSQIATQGQGSNQQGTYPTFEERSFEAFRSYYQYLPKGVTTIEYTVRLNNVGDFKLPPSRVEAMYAPEMYGETPNANVTVVAP